jgi:hypothetical protein
VTIGDETELRRRLQLRSLHEIEEAIGRLADLEALEPLAVPFSILKYILQDAAYRLDGRPITLDVREKLRERLAPLLLKILDVADTEDRDALVRIMNGTVKEWLALRATLGL